MKKRSNIGLKVDYQKVKSWGLILLALFFAISLIRNIVKVQGAKKEIEEARLRVEKLKQENQELAAKLDVTKSNSYTEKELRDKLGLSKEGEIVVVLPEVETLKKLGETNTQEEETLPDPTWKKWLNLFY